MTGFTRRGALAAFASLSAGAAVAKPFEPERSAEDQAIWHLEELYRLIDELGARHISVMAVGLFGQPGDHKAAKLIAFTTDHGLMNGDDMFDAKGGAANG